MKNILRGFVLGTVLLGLASCNIYAPFNSKSSATDYLEEATKCLNNGDYACAISNYEQLPEGNLKNQKMCTGYLSKTGLSLNVLLNIVTKADLTMLGTLANAMVPWSATRSSDAAHAKGFCVSFQQSNPSDSSAALFSTMGYLVECAVLMAKTDLFIGVDNNDAVCNTPGNQTGSITKSDIDGGAGKKMCTQEAIACGYDMATITSLEYRQLLQAAGLNNIANALNVAPAGLKEFKDSSAGQTGIAADAYRAAISDTLSAR